MGGIGNLKGAVVGGLIIGVIQAVSDDYAQPVWTNAIVFAILILIMVFRRRACSARRRAKDERAAEHGAFELVPSAKSVPPWGWGVLWIGLAILYPYITDSIDLPILGGHDDLLDASIQTLGYIIMALGLNIVVGFAGLLDLGYVAFYAIGTFVIGWFGRSSSRTSTAARASTSSSSPRARSATSRSLASTSTSSSSS